MPEKQKLRDPVQSLKVAEVKLPAGSHLAVINNASF